MLYITALLSGLVFGIGLIISGMTDPAKVIAFLDVAGKWNPSLAFVMLGAIAVAYLPFKLAKSRSLSYLHEPMSLPRRTAIDAKLVGGAIVFGIGWGLAGYCPGPALVSLMSSAQEPLIFVLAMLAGMTIYELLQKITAR